MSRCMAVHVRHHMLPEALGRSFLRSRPSFFINILTRELSSKGSSDYGCRGGSGGGRGGSSSSCKGYASSCSSSSCKRCGTYGLRSVLSGCVLKGLSAYIHTLLWGDLRDTSAVAPSLLREWCTLYHMIHPLCTQVPRPGGAWCKELNSKYPV